LFSTWRLLHASCGMYIYHERQLGGLCGVHCLNNLLQGPQFGPGDLAEIGVHLDQQERALVRQGAGDTFGTEATEAYNVDSSADGGNFSIQVLSVALKRFQLELVSSRHPNMKVAMKDPAAATEAFLCQSRDHWFAIRKVAEEWWNLNSTRKRPAKVSPFYLAAWLAQLETEGNTIFLVLGALPAPSPPAGSDHHLLENFHDLAELRERASKSGGNPLASEADSGDEGALWMQAMVEDQVESKPRISTEQALSSMREMGFKTNQIEIALRLASGNGEVASHFLAAMEPVEPYKALEDATTWAKVIQASVLGLDLEMASMERLVQGMLRVATLLDCPQEIQRNAVDLVDLLVLARFLRDILKHQSKTWDTAVANAGEMLASLLSLGATRQRQEAVGADDVEVIIRL